MNIDPKWSEWVVRLRLGGRSPSKRHGPSYWPIGALDRVPRIWVSRYLLP